MVLATFQLLLTVLGAVAAAVAAVLSHLDRQKTGHVGEQVASVRLEINGRMDQLLASAFARGFAAGQGRSPPAAQTAPPEPTP